MDFTDRDGQFLASGGHALHIVVGLLRCLGHFLGEVSCHGHGRSHGLAVHIDIFGRGSDRLDQPIDGPLKVVG